MKTLTKISLIVSLFSLLPLSTTADEMGDLKVTGYDIEANSSKTTVALKELTWQREGQYVGIDNIIAACEPGRNKGVVRNCVTHSNITIDEVMFKVAVKNILGNKDEKKLIDLAVDAPEQAGDKKFKSWQFKFSKIEFGVNDPDFHFTMTKEGLLRFTVDVVGSVAYDEQSKRLRVALKKVKIAGVNITKAVIALLKIVDLPRNFRMDANDLVVENL